MQAVALSVEPVLGSTDLKQMNIFRNNSCGTITRRILKKLYLDAVVSIAEEAFKALKVHKSETVKYVGIYV